MKILVTGGSGFLGSHVADELTNNGHKVIIYDLLKSKWLKKIKSFYLEILQIQKNYRD